MNIPDIGEGPAEYVGKDLPPGEWYVPPMELSIPLISPALGYLKSAKNRLKGVIGPLLKSARTKIGSVSPLAAIKSAMPSAPSMPEWMPTIGDIRSYPYSEKYEGFKSGLPQFGLSESVLIRPGGNPIRNLFDTIRTKVMGPESLLEGARDVSEAPGILSRIATKITPSTETIGKIARYGIPAAIAAAVIGAAAYGIYRYQKSKKAKAAVKQARSQAVEHFMKAAASYAPVVFGSRKDIVDRVEAVANEYVRDAQSQDEAAEGLADLMKQILTLERRLNPVPGYRPAMGRGGQLRAPIIA